MSGFWRRMGRWLQGRGWVLLLAGVVLPGLAYPAWRHLSPVMAAAGWDYRVFHGGIARVSALARNARGELFITQELLDGRGTLLKRDAGGQLTTVLAGLSKPDGLALHQDQLVLTQEGGEQPVLRLQGERVETLFRGRNLEGLTSDGRYLYAIEDLPQGRLLRYDPQTAEVLILREGLAEGEGLSVCADGRLFYTEKAKGWVKQWQATGDDRLVQANLRQPGFLLCDAQGLWITEDATRQARVLLLTPEGQLQVVLKHLHSAQSLIALAPGHYLVAEQGRDRILHFTAATPESR